MSGCSGFNCGLTGRECELEGIERCAAQLNHVSAGGDGFEPETPALVGRHPERDRRLRIQAHRLDGRGPHGMRANALGDRALDMPGIDQLCGGIGARQEEDAQAGARSSSHCGLDGHDGLSVYAARGIRRAPARLMSPCVP